jgi:hypothetical protein
VVWAVAAATVLALTASCDGGDGARRRTPPPVTESFSPTSVSRIGLTVLLSVALGTGSCALGLALSTHGDLAAGGTITLVVAVVFLISLVLSPKAACSGCLCGAAPCRLAEIVGSDTRLRASNWSRPISTPHAPTISFAPPA